MVGSIAKVTNFFQMLKITQVYSIITFVKMINIMQDVLTSLIFKSHNVGYLGMILVKA